MHSSNPDRAVASLNAPDAPQYNLSIKSIAMVATCVFTMSACALLVGETREIRSFSFSFEHEGQQVTGRCREYEDPSELATGDRYFKRCTVRWQNDFVYCGVGPQLVSAEAICRPAIERHERRRLDEDNDHTRENPGYSPPQDPGYSPPEDTGPAPTPPGT